MSVRRSLGISALTQLATFLLTLLGVTVVSRLLSPAEIGIFSVSTTLVAFAHIFRDFGAGQYLIQVREVTRHTLRASFSVMLGISCLIAGSLYLVRGPVAGFYENDGVARVLELLALNFLILPFGAPLLTLLRREMQFGRIAVVNVGSLSVQTAVTIGTAFAGQSYLSMAWGSLAGTLTSVVILVIIYPHNALLLPTFKGLGEVVRFGTKSSATSLVNEVGNSAPDLVFGRTLGFEAVAYYSRANGLLSMVSGQLVSMVRGVYFPAFARSVREGKEPGPLYAQSMAYIVGITAPAFALMSLLAAPLITFMFGTQWERSAPLASLLCLYAVLNAPFAMAHASAVACGKVGTVMRFQFVLQGVRVMVLLSSIWLPLEQVVLLLGGFAIFETCVQSGLLHYALGLRPGLLWRHVRSAYALIPLTLLGPAIVLRSSDLFAFDPGVFLTLVLSGLLALAGWLAGVICLGHPLRQELMRFMPKRKA